MTIREWMRHANAVEERAAHHEQMLRLADTASFELFNAGDRPFWPVPWHTRARAALGRAWWALMRWTR